MIVQLGLAFAFVTAAALLHRGAINAGRADPCLRFEQGLLVDVDSGLAGHDEAQGRALYRAALERLRPLHGIESVSLGSSVPFGMFSDGRRVRAAIPDRLGEVNPNAGPGKGPGFAQPASEAKQPDSTADPDGSVHIHYPIVSDDYFRSPCVPMLRGREFDHLEAFGRDFMARRHNQ
ncbi:MAG: hypothetical protein N3G20_07150 [Verrucomicrobiae bacterium]|nr:hypothetical protein [Verrucomicrobiae bacterium]